MYLVNPSTLYTYIRKEKRRYLNFLIRNKKLNV